MRSSAIGESPGTTSRPQMLRPDAHPSLTCVRVSRGLRRFTEFTGIFRLNLPDYRGYALGGSIAGVDHQCVPERS